MSTLYEIDERIKILENFNVDLETGEYLTDDDFNELFDKIQMELDDKIENTLCFAKDLLADVQKFKNEANKITERAKQKERLANRLQNRIDYFIRNKHTDCEGILDVESLNKYKFETPKVSVKYTKSNVVDIQDLSKIPSEFLTIKTETKADKNSIKKYLKNDDNKIDGAKILTKYNIKID